MSHFIRPLLTRDLESMRHDAINRALLGIPGVPHPTDRFRCDISTCHDDFELKYKFFRDDVPVAIVTFDHGGYLPTQVEDLRPQLKHNPARINHPFYR